MKGFSKKKRKKIIRKQVEKKKNKLKEDEGVYDGKGEGSLNKFI